MSVTLTFEQLATIVGGLVGLFLVVWRARPYVQGEVQKAVTPIREELHAWRKESVTRHDETQATAREILSILRPLETKVELLERGNDAGKTGIRKLSGDGAARETRIHNLEVHAGFVDLNGAAQKAAKAAT